MLSDQLTSLTVVTAAGKTLTASATQNPELFWAMRGAGHQFGVVTEVTLKVHDQINGGVQLQAEVVYEAASVLELFTLLRDMQVPPGLAVAIVFLGVAPTDESSGGVSVFFFFFFVCFFFELGRTNIATCVINTGSTSIESSLRRRVAQRIKAARAVPRHSARPAVGPQCQLARDLQRRNDGMVQQRQPEKRAHHRAQNG
jgi:hypothetical protein